MALIRHKKKVLSAGLSWNQLTQKNYKAEAINLSEHEGRPFGSIYKTSYEDDNAYYLGITDNKKELGNISAAAVFSAICENAMIVDSISEKSAWWCVSIHNQILTQTDKVYDKDDLTRDDFGLIPFIQEALPEILEDESIDFKIYAAPEVAELIQDLVGEVEVITTTLTELIDLDERKFPSDFTKYRVKKISGSSPIVLLGMAVLLIGSGYYFFLYEQEPEQLNIDMSGLSSIEADRNEPEKIINKVPPSQKDEELLVKALEEEKKWLIEDLNAFNLNSILVKVYQAYKNTPLYIAGWSLSEIRYQKSLEPGKIILKWHKDFGTAGDFRHFWEKSGVDYAVNMDGKTAFVYLDFENKDKVTGNINDLYTQFKNSKYDKISLMSDLDKYDFNWIMNIKEEEPRREAVEGLHNKELASIKQLSLDRVGFEVEGRDSIAGFFNTVELSNKTNLILADQVIIDVSKGFEWLIKGELYNVK